MPLPKPLESKREVLSRYFDLDSTTPSQVARLDTLALYELARRYGQTKNMLLFGGQAYVTFFPSLRETVDIDLAVNNGGSVGIFRELGYQPTGSHGRALKKESYKRRVGNVEVDLDVFRPGQTVIGGTMVDEEMFTKSIIIDNFEIPINVCNPVDLIATKVGAGRPKDAQDIVQTVLGKSGEIDKEYLWQRLSNKRRSLLEIPDKAKQTISRADAQRYRTIIEELLPE